MRTPYLIQIKIEKLLKNNRNSQFLWDVSPKYVVNKFESVSSDATYIFSSSNTMLMQVMKDEMS